ncbi:transcription-silencing protein Clr2-domain-containing protein [Aspergillus egyptiacus]|nr:transcription-silencing protein Clr2-domain-containing protein [Aspergillus egyptiacus]
MYPYPSTVQDRHPPNFQPTTQQSPETDAMEEEEGDFVVIPIDHTFSDGDESKWPTEEKYSRPDDSYYRQKLAEMWLRETGAYEEGVEYMLDDLPDGYALFDRPRGTNPSIRDRFLYGHPVGQYFSSTKHFYPHFYYLMTGGTTKCPCDLCMKLEKRQKETYTGARRGRPPGSRNIARPPQAPGERPPGRPPGRPRGRPPGRPPTKGLGRPGRPPGRPGSNIVDNEGTPDVFKYAVMRLKQLGNLDKEVKEELSMDWRAERTPMEDYLETVDMRPSYLPRLGELVLWTADFDGELAWNPTTQCIQIYRPAKDQWLEKPEWRAGVVGQIPTENSVLQDLVETTPKRWDLNYSGFRVETLPDPNGSDKSYSLHYAYVPLKCIKPLNAFELFLQGIPREQFHPSIENAMTVMSSFSLVEKYRFRGAWPNASIYCKGIFIGAEFLVKGDAVRLKPKGYRAGNTQNPPVTDVMVVDEIRLELLECDEDPKSKQLAEEYRVRISGKLYTPSVERVQILNRGQPPRALSQSEIMDVFNSVGMGGYGNWYELHAGSIVDVSQDMILGRCYEPVAMKLLLDSLSLDYDLPGVMNAREYSSNVDERIPEGKRWFWGDFRTQTLAIETLNGEDVGHYSETRDVKMWRANLRIIDGTASQADFREAKQPSELGRPSAKPRISSLAEVSKTSKLVSTGLGNVDTSNPVSESEDEDIQALGEIRDGEGTNGQESEESEPEEDFTTRIEDLRGGTEESEGGDYVPDFEPSVKRLRHGLEDEP